MTALPTVAVDLRALVPEATGIGVYTRSLLEALVARGGARYLGLSHAPPRDPQALEGAGVPFEVQSAPLGVLWQQIRLPRRLRQGDVDVFWSPLHTLPWRTPVPSVITVHDLTVWLYPEAHTRKVRLSQRPFFRRSLQQAEAVICVSQATADDLQRFFPDVARRVEVVLSGVDPFFHPAEEEEIAAIRHDLGCPDGYLLYVGTLEPRKNLDLLLTVWERLRRDDENTPPLLLVGSSGWHSGPLRQRIAQLEPLGLRHLGHLDRLGLRRAYQGARAFLYPSFYEGFGLPPLEAMACGVPVAVSNVSSLPEVVENAGLLLPPQDIDAWATAIRRLLDEEALAQDLRHRGLQRAATLTWQRTAETMEQILLASC
ncbi:MAG: glycosyltransferase family 1 protein [Acidobacteriota bacterium]|nr:glycosyltransferase family 1 protein [Acidobacteriota bacterium]